MTEEKSEKKKEEPEEEIEEKSIKIIIDGEKKEAKYRKFKSGIKGYGCYGMIKIKGYPYRLSLNLIEM